MDCNIPKLVRLRMAFQTHKWSHPGACQLVGVVYGPEYVTLSLRPDVLISCGRALANTIVNTSYL